jgi:uncharacterized membrane protein
MLDLLKINFKIIAQTMHATNIKPTRQHSSVLGLLIVIPIALSIAKPKNITVSLFIN